jgi:NADPH-dependent 2,4-dienoyl-CoA reductase/sulfur reductase-like enzyme
MTERFVIIGGGPTAAAAVGGYRDAGGTGEIVLVSNEHELPYDRPELSKEFLRGDTGEKDLPLHTRPYYAEHGVTLIGDDSAAEIDPNRRQVTLHSGRTLDYDTCLLATGARPRVLDVPGSRAPGIHTLRSLASCRRLRADAAHADRAVVIGSGFIGCEASASLSRLGLDVTIVTDEESPQQRRLGPEAGHRIAGWLSDQGVELLFGSPVAEINHGVGVTMTDRHAVESELLLMATGITPNAELADTAGIELERGRVPVDAHMRSDAPGLLAAGDVALAHNAAADRPLAVEHWDEAEAMGAIAGVTAAGDEATWDRVPTFWSVIGDKMIQYAAWGDGYDDARLVDHGDGAFTVWYGRDGTTVGVLTHDADEDYERGHYLVAHRAPLPV